MSNRWLNRITFWALCIVPFATLILTSKMMGPIFFYTGLLFYFFLYRPFVHINRLLQLGAIEEREAWRQFVPFYGSRYVKTLWLG